MKEGSRTPWGTADSVDQVEEGIFVVGTPSHGGIKLYPKWNRQIPEMFQNKNGWYEEDCEANIPVYFLPIANFGKVYPKITKEELRTNAKKALKCYFWKEWEEYSGENIPVEESHSKKEFIHEQENKDRMLVLAAKGCDDKAFCEVFAGRGGRLPNGSYPKDNARYIISANEYEDWYKNNGGLSFVIDESKYQKIMS